MRILIMFQPYKNVNVLEIATKFDQKDILQK